MSKQLLRIHVELALAGITRSGFLGRHNIAPADWIGYHGDRYYTVDNRAVDLAAIVLETSRPPAGYSTNGWLINGGDRGWRRRGEQGGKPDWPSVTNAIVVRSRIALENGR